MLKKAAARRISRDCPLALSIRFTASATSMLLVSGNHHHGITNGCECHKPLEAKKKERAGRALSRAPSSGGGVLSRHVCSA
ncbi:MAG: hypothetical protein KAS74_03740 [Methanosarcinales archaeon]|jgi:hypothetical protein|nr:hypothetical protein [Methanosarcinales archaeon]